MLFPDAALTGERTFAAVFDAVEDGGADAVVVPVENSTAGAVADVYDLLLGHESLVVVGEAILRVRHCLLGPSGARLEDVREARSHPQALAQSESFLRARGIEAREAYDTAGAARDVRDLGDRRIAAIASRRAADHLGLTWKEIRAIPPAAWGSNQKAHEQAADTASFRFLTNFVKQKRREFD